jgi:hypothetical protein
MASSEVVNVVIDMASEMLTYLLPVIGVMTAITFVVSMLWYWTIGVARRIHS